MKICNASGALWEEWLARSGRWNDGDLISCGPAKVKLCTKPFISPSSIGVLLNGIAENVE